MWTEAIFLRFCKLRRPLGALMILLLLLGLCACSSAAPTPAPAPTAAPESRPETGPEPVLPGRWTCPVDIGGEVSAALGFDLRPWLSAPLLAELRLEIGAEGGCTLTRDDRACAEELREALAACLRELQEQENGQALGGLALAEALGADPNEFAAALCDELLPAPTVTAGRYDAEHGEIRWNGGAVSAVIREDSALRIAVPDGEALLFSPAD